MSFLETWNAAATPLAAAVLNSFVFGAVLAACTYLFFRYARGLNAATRHIFLWAVLGALVAIPLVRPSADLLRDVTQSSVTLPDSVQVAPAVDAESNTKIPEPVTPSPASLPFEIDAGYLPLYFVAAWLLICCVQVARVFSSYLYLRRLKSASVPAERLFRLSLDEWVLGCGVRRNVRLLVSDQVTSPLAAGFRQPAVIVPQGMIEKLSPEDVDHVLLHELAHLARRDDWTNLIARLASGFLVLHPFAAWILRRIDVEREIACDDWVVAATGAPKPYAESLARLVEFRLARTREMLATGIGGRQSHLTDRIERLLRAGSRFDARASFARLAAVMLTLSILVLGSAHSPEWVAFAQTAPPAPPDAPSATPEPPHESVPAVEPPAPPELSQILTATPSPAPRPPRPARVYAFAQPVPVPPATPSPAPRPPRPARVYAFAQPAPAPPAPPQARSDSSESGESFLGALANAGYRDLSVEEIIELKSNGITAAYLTHMNQAGWGKLTVQQLIELRNHGVTPEYLQQMRDVGFKNLALTETIDLRNHGVKPAMIGEIHALGFGPYSVKQIIEFVNHGARTDFFKALKEAGFERADPKEILEARTHGVTRSSLLEARKYGANLTLRQIIKLRSAGVI